MKVRFRMTNKGEVAILPRKEFKALAAKAREADEDVGSARLVARARREIAAGMPLVPKDVVDRNVPVKMHCAWFASGVVKRSFISRKRSTSDRVIFPIWKVDGGRERPQP